MTENPAIYFKKYRSAIGFSNQGEAMEGQSVLSIDQNFPTFDDLDISI